MLRFRKRDADIEKLLLTIDVLKNTTMQNALFSSEGNKLFKLLADAIKNKWNKEHISVYKEKLLEGELPEAFVCNYIVHTCANKLESGSFHIYSGVLNDEGLYYKTLFEWAIDTMINKGCYSREWANENLRKTVYKNISEIG